MKYLNNILLSFLFVAFFLSSLCVGSQNTRDLFASANKYFESGKYYEALFDLHIIVNSQDQILEKKTTAIHYMYAKSLLYLLKNNNDSVCAKLSLSGYTLPLKCYKSFEIAAADKSYAEKINADLKDLFPFIINSATSSLDNDLLTYAQNFINIAQLIEKDNPKNNFIMAVMDLKKEDTITAKNLFIKAINELDNKNTTDALMISKSYYYLAIINNGYHKNASLAMQKLDEASSLLEKLKTDNAINSKEYWYNKNNYNSYLLDIYLNYSEKEDEAIAKFKEVVEANPSNYSLIISLAQLLAKNHKEESIEYYIKATQVDAENYIAYYNLGAIYLNEGISFYDLSKSTKDAKLAKQYYFNYQEKYAEAYVWMQSALEKNKEDLKILYSLKRIAAGLYYPDDYQQYDMMISKIEYRKSIKGK